MARPAPREVWWAQVDKVRICVVLRVEPDFAYVVYGQTVHDPTVPSELVKTGSFAGKRMKLRNDTSFRSTNTAMLRDEDFKTLIVKPCPPSLFDILQRIVAAASQPEASTDADAKPSAADRAQEEPVPLLAFHLPEELLVGAEEKRMLVAPLADPPLLLSATSGVLTLHHHLLHLSR